MDLEGLSREVAAIQALRAEQEDRLEGMARLFRDLHEQVRRTEHLREIQAEVEARSLEQVEFLRSRMEGEFFQRVESLAAAFEESRRSHRQSSSTVASVMRRMEARLQDAVGQPRPALPEGTEQESRPEDSRLEPLSRRLDDLVVRLETLESDSGRPGGSSALTEPEGLLARLEALEARSAVVADPEGLLARLEALEARSAVLADSEGLPARLEALEARSAQLGEQQAVALTSADLEELAQRVGVLEPTLGRLERLEAHLESLPEISVRLDLLENLQERLEQGAVGTEERLAGALSVQVDQALFEALAPLNERIDRLPGEVQGLVEGLDFSGLTSPLIRRLDGLADEVQQARVLAESSELSERIQALEAQGLGARLDRVEGEMRRHAERLDEELEAVFEQNRLRVAEMTNAFDERMALLENAADRVRELEEATLRSRAETGHVLQAAFERMEALTGKMGQLEDQVSAVPPPQDPEILHELRGVVTHLESRMHFLEATPRHLVPATLEPARTFSPGSGTEEDPQEGLAPAELHGLPVQMSGGLAPPPGVAPQDLELLEQKIQDVELRVVEQALEALTESRLLREEYERIAHHLSELSENLNQHFGAIWDRLEPS
jgi:hypothetical protein